MKFIVMFLLILLVSGCTSTRALDSSSEPAEGEIILDGCEVKPAGEGPEGEKDWGPTDTLANAGALVLIAPLWLTLYVMNGAWDTVNGITDNK